MTSRLRILHCLSTREFAGTERHLAELSAIQARDHDVTLLLNRRTADPLTGGDISGFLCPDVKIVRAGAGGYLSALASELRSGRHDIVHTHLGRASARASWLRRAGLAGSVPVVATLHTGYRGRSYGTHDGLVCIASWQREALPERQRESCTLIPNWTVPPCSTVEHRAALRERMRREWNIPDGGVVIGAAGRMVEEKNFGLLIQAWKQAGLRPGTRLVLIGDGPERAALERAAQGCPEILFTGYRTDMPDLLAALDAFVVPSRHEPFGLVLLEAMEAGLPVCATAAGGVTDILAEAPECLVAPGCLASLVAGLRRLEEAGPRQWDMSPYRIGTAARRVEAFYRRYC
ncbi:glycosyltransferase [Gluconobacter roseus]|uniref:Glycosyl transferase n=1 Tax=Gluconobacter roseus NBRC 3990 TaxID=1307950 RepID=A0A4Y3M201_9PROT|nr:glycosyltransferase [Gluconobacter roseus]GBR44242.1 lipopolysaccharide core biosynthesis glycosyl transferase [Gluconobacter roseus NBRC 3990]GEB02554.1 glycosyl transferase [Gluconobacter roseus NBRC 3990]GLP93014.1 glycosyl transferase [Gluconobacter roseus NBRC 3990]